MPALIIRDEQMNQLSEEATASFVRRMVVHLKQFFPQHTTALGEPGVREASEYGITRAQTYGIVAESDVCKYIDLMFSLGRDFDRDPALPWAGGILRGEQAASVRVNRLYDRALEHLRSAAKEGR